MPTLTPCLPASAPIVEEVVAVPRARLAALEAVATGGCRYPRCHCGDDRSMGVICPLAEARDAVVRTAMACWRHRGGTPSAASRIARAAARTELARLEKEMGYGE